MNNSGKNESRQKTYQKHQQQKTWYHFEWYCVKHHQEKYGHQVWHWEHVPESELYKAGFIHDFNKHRLRRLALRKERLKEGSETEKENLHTDFGFDGLIYDSENDIYHGLQAKYWMKKRLRASDLGTFYMKIMDLKSRNVESVGYLYHTSKLATSLFESCQLKNGIIAEQLEYKLPDGRHNRKKLECNQELYRNQRLALKALKNADFEGLKLVNMICASGKTLVAGKWLAIRQPNLVICIAPLRLHVENLFARIPLFISHYLTLIVDSDITLGSTTKIDTIKDFLKRKEKRIIFTTYKSARDILSKIMKKKHYQYLIADEAHNITPRKPLLTEFVNKFSDGLLLTATPYKNMDTFMNFKTVYSYSLQEALKDKRACDYRVWIPLCTKEEDFNQIICDIPLEFSNLDTEMTQKALFLARGLLHTGSRKCIVYCRNTKECKKFNKHFSKILRKYHGLDCNISSITQHTSYDDRTKILEPFRITKESDTMIHIITSIRILDEAVDLPLCDSEFVTYVGDKQNDIRMVQRLMRGGRIVNENPDKINNLFIWSSDFDKSITVFSLLKSLDPEFSIKISTLSINYDIQNKKTVMKQEKKYTTDLHKYIDTKCVSLDEIWEIKRNKWLNFVKDFGRFPSKSSKNKSERSLSYWKQDQRKSYKNGKLSQDRIDRLNNTPYWKWEDETINRDYTPEQKMHLLIKICNDLGNVPNNSYIDYNTNIKIGSFYTQCKQGQNSELFQWAMDKCAILKLDYEKFLCKKDANIKYTPSQKMAKLIGICDEFGNVPIISYIDPETNIRIGSFLADCRIGKNRKLYEQARKQCSILEKDYQRYLAKNKDKIKYTPQQKMDRLIEVCNEMGKVPIYKYIDPETELNLGCFLQYCRNGKFHKKLYEEARNKCEILEADYQLYINKNNKIKYTTAQKMDRLIEICNEFGYAPAKNYIDPKTDIKIGQFLKGCNGGRSKELYTVARSKCKILDREYNRYLDKTSK